MGRQSVNPDIFERSTVVPEHVVRDRGNPDSIDFVTKNVYCRKN